MNTIRVRVEPYHGTIGAYTPTVPITVPDLNAVRQLAHRLHETGEAWQGDAFGWSAEYQPEIDEQETEIEVYDTNGHRHTVREPFWSPAAFMIGESGIWFFSMSWEQGSNEDPVEFVDDRNVLALN